MPDKDTNVWVPWWSQKYSVRPDSMLDVCYADFAAYYISYSGPPPKSDIMDCVEDDNTETPAAGRPSLPVITVKMNYRPPRRSPAPRPQSRSPRGPRPQSRGPRPQSRGPRQPDLPNLS